MSKVLKHTNYNIKHTKKFKTHIGIKHITNLFLTFEWRKNLYHTSLYHTKSVLKNVYTTQKNNFIVLKILE